MPIGTDVTPIVRTTVVLARKLDAGDAILDGEVIAADETGRPQFYDLLRHTRVPAYVAFGRAAN